MRSWVRPPRRTGFTLLEVVLATAIGMLLVGALYVAMNVQLRVSQASRTKIEESTLVRSILARITNDIADNLGPIPTNNSSSGGRGGSGGAGGSTASGAGASGAGTSGSGATSGSSTSGTSTNAIVFNLGVQGDQTHVALYVSRLPRELDFQFNQFNQSSPIGDAGASGICDMRRITYWLAGNGGLARQELKNVTSDDLNSMPPDGLPNEESTYVIAEEVKNLAFSYFDGVNWNDTWDGTTPGNDGVTPIGPPMAIAVEVGIQFPGSSEIKKYRHVIPLLAANGQGNPPPPSNTTSSSSSSSSNTSGNSGP